MFPVPTVPTADSDVMAPKAFLPPGPSMDVKAIDTWLRIWAAVPVLHQVPTSTNPQNTMLAFLTRSTLSQTTVSSP